MFATDNGPIQASGKLPAGFAEVYADDVLLFSQKMFTPKTFEVVYKRRFPTFCKANEKLVTVEFSNSVYDLLDSLPGNSGEVRFDILRFSWVSAYLEEKFLINDRLAYSVCAPTGDYLFDIYAPHNSALANFSSGDFSVSVDGTRVVHSTKLGTYPFTVDAPLSAPTPAPSSISFCPQGQRKVDIFIYGESNRVQFDFVQPNYGPSSDELFTVLASELESRNRTLCVDDGFYAFTAVSTDSHEDYYFHVFVDDVAQLFGEISSEYVAHSVYAPLVPQSDDYPLKSNCTASQRFVVVDIDASHTASFGWDVVKIVSGGPNEVKKGGLGSVHYEDCLDYGPYFLEIADFGFSGSVEYTVKVDGELKISKTMGGIGALEVIYIEPTFTPPPTYAPFPGCAADQCQVDVRIYADNHPEDNSWMLVRKSDGSIVDYSSTPQSKSLCVSTGSYVWILNDKKGDGMCCENGKGSFRLELNEQLVSQGTFRDTSATASFICEATQTTASFKISTRSNSYSGELNARFKSLY
jgi:hypothetical protein